MLSFLNALSHAHKSGSISLPPSLPIFSLPPYFPWVPDFQIFEHEDGHYTSDYDPAADKPSGTTLFVDPVNGDDSSGTGSEIAPYKSLGKAYDEGADVVNITSGWIDRTLGFPEYFDPERDFALVAVDGPGSVVWTRSHPQSTLSWVQESSPNTNVYKAAGITDVRTALDLAYGRDGIVASEELQKDGASPVPIPYSAQTSVAAVQANAGSYYDNGVDLYIHTHDSRPPDADIKLLKTESLTNIISDITVYIEGIEIWGDNSLTFNVGNTASAKFIGVNMACRFTGDGDDSFNFDDLSDVRLLRCSASDNSVADGFNYHRNVGGGAARTQILEWDCDARRNGNAGSDNDNGSTTHDGVRCIRLNGIYEYNKGPNVADTAGAQTINLNCQGNYSQAASSSQEAGFLSGSYSIDEAATMYLKNCSATGNSYGRMRATGGQMIDLGGFSTDSTNSGSILDGTDPFFLTLGSIAPDAINGFYCVMESDFFDNQSGEIDDLFDASPFKNNLATPGTRPDYSAANALAGGMPAFDFGTAANGDIFTAAKSGTYKEIIIAGAYKEGLDTAFDDEIVITTNAAGGNRISGASASAELNSGGFASSVSINGAAVTATLLPTGFSVLRFTGASAITGLQNFFGEPSQPTRSWQGPVGLLLTSKRDLSTDEFSGILGAIQDKFSIA